MKGVAKRKDKRKCRTHVKFLVLFLVLQGLPIFSATALIDASIIASHRSVNDKNTARPEERKKEMLQTVKERTEPEPR